MNKPDYIKTCARCQRDKPADCFRPCKTTRDKIQSWCKDCFRENALAHYKKNQARYDARRSELYHKNKNIKPVTPPQSTDTSDLL